MDLDGGTDSVTVEVFYFAGNEWISAGSYTPTESDEEVTRDFVFDEETTKVRITTSGSGDCRFGFSDVTISY